MEEKTFPCECGRNAKMFQLPVHGVFMIKCECGKRTAADTEESAVRFWKKWSEEERKDNDIR